jgi:ribonuclease HI
MPSSIAKQSPRWFHERRPSDHTGVKKVQLITDGACLGNPGPGGWAAILRHGDHRREMFGYAPLTTNNRMEMTAAIEGLRAIKESCEVEVVTDSEYVKNGITQWIHNWKRNDWKRSDKKPVLNSDLWQELDEEVGRHKTTWVWTKGHASHAENNRADELANLAARERKSGDRVVAS